MATDKVDQGQAQLTGEPAGMTPPESPGLQPPVPRRRRSDRVQPTAQVVVAVAVVLGICYVAKVVLIVLLVSILLAFMLGPIVDGLQRIKVPRPVGALVALLLVFALLWGISLFFYSRAVDFVQDLPKYSEKIRESIGRVRQQAQKLQKTKETMLPETKEEKAAVRVTQQTGWAEVLTKGVGTVWDVVLTIFFIPFLVYFMLTWQEHVRAATVMLFRLENRQTAYVTLGRISAMIRSFIVGNVLMGLFLSIVSTIVFAILQLPYFYFLGFISGFLSLVPYLGVVLAMVPPLVAGLGQLRGGGMLAIAITVLGLHLFAINVLYPKLMGKRLQLNPLVVTVALLLWGWIWGAMGLVLAVPITAALKIIFDHVDSLRAYGAWLGD